MQTAAPPTPTLEFAANLRLILGGLLGMLGRFAIWQPLCHALFGKLNAIPPRLDILLARYHAGKTWKQPAPCCGGGTRKRSPGSQAGNRRSIMNRRFGWLARDVGWQAAGYAAQLEHQLCQPEITTFLQACPPARRLLRPLCRTLQIGLPWTRPAPAEAHRPRPARARRPAEPPFLIPLPRGTLTAAKRHRALEKAIALRRERTAVIISKNLQ